MKLSKKSWHYRVYEKFASVPPSNLCSYFWTYVFMFFIGTLASFMAVAALSGMIYLAVHKFHYQEDTDFHRSLSNAGETGYILIGSAVTTLIFFCIFKSGFVKKYWKALIGKYCPKIEWTESEKIEK